MTHFFSHTPYRALLCPFLAPHELPHLFPRAPLLRLSPPHSQALHVFARTPASGYAEVEVKNDTLTTVAALQRAIIGELKLSIPPHKVRLLLEEEGGQELKALDSRKTLAAEGVKEAIASLCA